MPYPIQNLLQGRGDPVTAKPNDKVSSALAVMVEHDYSQLPVVDEIFKTLGMITYQSIVAAMDYFQARADQLRVAHATVNHPGNIQDTPEQLAALRRWAVDATIRFRRVLDDALAVAALESA